MSEVEKKLVKMGHVLGKAKAPVANYLGTKQIGELLFVSARVSEQKGTVGLDVSEEVAKIAARDTMLYLLSIIKEDIGNLDKISSIVKLQGFVNANKTCDYLPQIIDGASELLIELYGENGRHARTATGASQLPYGATIQLDMIVEINNTKTNEE